MSHSYRSFLVVMLFALQNTANAAQITYSDQHAISRAFVSAPGGDGDSEEVIDQILDAVDFEGSTFLDYSGFGFDCTSDARWTSQFSPASPGLGGSFTSVRFDGLSTTSVSMGSIENTLQDQAIGQTYLGFTLTEPTQWSLTGNIKGLRGGLAGAAFYFGLFDTVAGTTVAEFQRSGVGGPPPPPPPPSLGEASRAASGSVTRDVAYDELIGIGGVLAPGSYVLQIQNTSIAFGYFGPKVDEGLALAEGVVFSVPSPGAAATIGLGMLFSTRRRRF